MATLVPVATAQNTNPSPPTNPDPPPSTPPTNPLPPANPGTNTPTPEIDIDDVPSPILRPVVSPLELPQLLIQGQPTLVGYPAVANAAIEPLAILRLPFPEVPLWLFPPGHRQLTSGSLPSNFPAGLLISPPLLSLDPSLLQGMPNVPGTTQVPYIYIDPGQQSEVSPITIPSADPNVVVNSPSQTLGLSPAMENCYGHTQSQAEIDSGLANQLIQCYTQNLEVAQQHNNQAWTAYALNNLAVAHFIRGDYRQALAYHQQLLTQAQAQASDLEIGIALAGLGAAHAALGQYDQAIEQYRQALDHLPQAKAPQWRALTLRNLGNALLGQGQIQSAIEYQHQSLAISGAIGDTYGQAQARGNLGNAYALSGRFDDAVTVQQQSLELARQLQDPLQEAQALLGLGTTYGYQQDYDQAVDYYGQALTLTRRLQARLGEGIALTNLGDALFRLNRLSEAEGRLYQGIAIWESLRAGLGTNDSFKVSIFETQAATYRNLQEVLVAQGKIQPALEVAERGRARAFVELVARRSGAQLTAPSPPTIAAISRLARQQNLALVEYSIIRDQFVETPHGASVQFTNEPQESALFAWVVQPSGQVKFQRLDWPADWPSLEQVVQQGRRAMGLRGRGIDVVYTPEPRSDPDAATDLQRLHRLLIEPIAAWLPPEAETPVVFVPQEELFLVPFPALQDAEGQYFLAHHTPMTAPSIQLLGLTLERANRRQVTMPSADWLIVGNPMMPSVPLDEQSPQPLPELPGAEAEAVAIAALVNSQALTGATATESLITQRLPQARYIHLATHGLLDDIDGEGIPGAIALTPDNHEDGFLTANELFQLKLQADLVVLSACDTGGGRITGDGVIGLSRSFLSSGANSVVVSLWTVPDVATADLMTAFYQALPTTSHKAQALRQAMLSTQQRHPHPSAWAGFTLIGDWR
ncbi:CHAT domain-containing protein [Halomicronema hongdechloris]|nr:CHAT domain-containing tetratricopeptide repeat protein [Halomicronema hongdechloris]